MSLSLLIRGCRIIDGSGAPWFYGDLGVAGDRIAVVAPHHQRSNLKAEQVIDAQGLALCPGFIDIQSQSPRTLWQDGRCLSKISQGITTEIMGEAWTPAPVQEPVESAHGPDRRWTRIKDWLDALVAHGVSPNVGTYLPASNLRSCVMGMQMGDPTPRQLQTMQQITADAMLDGAFGVAYALIYPPDTYTSTEEIIAICQTVAAHGGSYITHLRSEGDLLLEALDEAITIGRQARLPVEVYHLKAHGPHNWHKMQQVIERMEVARCEGIDIAANMYPYIASGTGLTIVLPPWIAADGKLYENLDDPVVRQKIRQQALGPGSKDWEPLLQPDRVQDIMPIGFNLPQHQAYAGKRLDEIARMMQLEPVDAVIELLRAERQRIFTVYFKMSEDNLRLQMRQPWVKFSTDAPGLDPSTAKGPAHPRSYGSMPRVLGRYVRQQQVLSLEDAVARMSWHVACRLGIKDRGLLSPGAMADLVLFDPDTVTDCATFEDSHQLSKGVIGVWVNGARVWEPAGHTGAKPGRAVLHQSVAAS